MKRINRSAIVEVPAGAVYALVEEIEAYPCFLPWCVAAQVRSREPGRTVATLTAGLGGLRQSFTTENRNRDGEAIDMQLVEGPFRRFAARWRFTPLAARAARVEFSMEYEFSSAVLGRALEPLFGTIADTMLDAFARRADEIHGQAQD